MKDKLTLKELASYLPYKLSYLRNGKYSSNTMTGLDIDVWTGDYHDEDIKPILRPLSSLYTCKGKNGKTLPTIWAEQDSMGEFFLEYDNITLKSIPGISYRVFVSLVQHHFDVFGLIERGLAIEKTAQLQ